MSLQGGAVLRRHVEQHANEIQFGGGLPLGQPQSFGGEQAGEREIVVPHGRQRLALQPPIRGQQLLVLRLRQGVGERLLPSGQEIALLLGQRLLFADVV